MDADLKTSLDGLRTTEFMPEIHYMGASSTVTIPLARYVLLSMRRVEGGGSDEWPRQMICPERLIHLASLGSRWAGCCVHVVHLRGDSRNCNTPNESEDARK